MSSEPEIQDPSQSDFQSSPADFRFLINIILFILTFFTTTVAGVQWIGKDPFELTNLSYGLSYSFAILFVLGTHEFGHYFAARYHNVKATLPFFLPFPPLPFFLNFGTLGAVIRTRSVVPSRKAMFDIGVAGPLAGFIACLIILVYGFLTLPGPEYILSIHPNYDFSLNGTGDAQGVPLEFGHTILYSLFSRLFADPSTQYVPPMTEMYHYPFLCVGWFGLFVTAMNLIPIGQFDGGHIIFTMFGDRHQAIAKGAFIILLILGLPSLLDSLIRTIIGYVSHEQTSQIIPFAHHSWVGWFLWAMISYYVVKLYHPPVPDETLLDDVRMRIGWLSIIIFVLCFSLVPFTIPI